jgi:predicted nucleic acid-binding protein
VDCHRQSEGRFPRSRSRLGSLYEARPDKGYSLSDCRSMLALSAHGVTEVLTNDHHFTQEGFTILFP